MLLIPTPRGSCIFHDQSGPGEGEAVQVGEAIPVLFLHRDDEDGAAGHAGRQDLSAGLLFQKAEQRLETLVFVGGELAAGPSLDRQLGGAGTGSVLLV